jgi:hypothetical protein
MPEAALQRKASSEVFTSAVVRRTTQTTTQATPEIANNPVYKIMLSEETMPEQKRDAVAAFLTFAGTKEENKARIKAYQEFEEYTQSVREQMAQEIIRLTDTETFSELKSVYDELNNALIDFDEKMRPLTDIVDAIYVLRTNDKTLDAFREIQSDRKTEEQQAELRAEIGRKFDENQQRITECTRDIAALGEEKMWFGFGGIKESARKQIAEREDAVVEARREVDRLQTQLADLDKAGPGETSLGEFAEQKAKLRELLDISSDTHKQRQKELVDSALSFVTLAKQRIGSVRQHLDKMNDQVDNLYDANSRMSGVYAVLAEGIKEAEVVNQTTRGGLVDAPIDETLIAKMRRDEDRMAIEDHIRALDASGANTVSTYADLTSQTIRIKTMRDANQSQMDKARVMHTQGVAGVADRLSVVLQAVSSAALGESSAMAKDTLATMVGNTNKVAQKEAIRVAMGVSELNDDVVKAIDDLGAYGEVMRASTDITRKGLAEMRDNLAKIKELAESVQGDIHENIAVAADVGANTARQRETPPATKNPFGLGA